MKRHHLSEAFILMKTRKILALKHELKLLKREEKLYKKRNTILVNHTQNEKEQLNTLEEERVELQRELFEQHYDKTLCEQDNSTLRKQYSSVMKDIQVLQTKFIDNWGEFPVGKNKKSTRKFPSMENKNQREESVSDNPIVDNNDPVHLYKHSQHLLSGVDSLNAAEARVSTPTGSIITLSSLEETPPISTSNTPILEVVCKTEIESTQESTTLTDVGTNSKSIASEQSGSSCSFYRRETVLLPRNSKPSDSFKTTGNDPTDIDLTAISEDESIKVDDLVSDSTVVSENQSIKTDFNGSTDEPFLGFFEDVAEKNRFSDIIKKLSATYERLDELRLDGTTKSLTIMETNPNVENTIIRPLETDMSKQFNLQTTEVSLPLLDLAPDTLLSWSVQSVKIKEESEMKKSPGWSKENTSNVSPDSSSHDVDSKPISSGKAIKEEISTKKQLSTKTSSTSHKSFPKRDILLDSASNPVPNERGSRRARNAVRSYKELTLNTKLRRS